MHDRQRQRTGNIAVARIDEDRPELLAPLQEADRRADALGVVRRLIEVVGAAVAGVDE